MKKLFLLLFVSAFLFSCGGKTEQPVSQPAVFAEADLFNADKAMAFAENVTEEDKMAAKQSFLKAIDAFRNNKSPEKAVPLFKESLLKNPDSKTYYEYGNALLELKEYPNAISALHMAEKLDYSPLSKVLYNLACAYSLSQDSVNSLKYLELAIQNGYTNAEHIMSDADMAFARNLGTFKKVYESAMSGASSPERALFDLFVNEFPEKAFPYTISAQQSQELTFENAIGYDYDIFVPDMRDAEFSREVGNEFYYVARFPKQGDYILTLYAERGLWMDNSPVNYSLYSYTPNGKIIDKMEVAGYPYFDSPLKAFSIKSASSFEVKEYATVWEKDTEEHGYEDNKIVKRELQSTSGYRISEKGKFLSAKPVLGML